MKFRRYPETRSASERVRVATLRRALPLVPAGWLNRPRSIRRLNGAEVEGVFGARFVTVDRSLVLMCIALPPTDRVQYSIRRVEGEVTSDEVERVILDWFDGEAEPTSRIDGVVYLRL